MKNENWTFCPKCKKELLEKKKLVDKCYGKNPTMKLWERHKTYIKDGFLFIGYYCDCSECGFKFEYHKKINMLSKLGEAIWEEENTEKSQKVLKQMCVDTGKREIQNLLSKSIPVYFKRGTKLIELKNGIETVLCNSSKFLTKFDKTISPIKKD